MAAAESRASFGSAGFLKGRANLHSIKGVKENIISQADFLYIRGGFKWKKWK
jgi:hypothetical protein